MNEKYLRRYLIKWYPKKEGSSGERTTSIQLSKPTGQVNRDAHSAVDLFVATYGSLKKNEIICIKEFDENGQIGEDIVPSSDENAIIPVGR